MKDVTRPDTTSQYEGIAKSNIIGNMAPQNFQPSNRIHTYGETLGPAHNSSFHRDNLTNSKNSMNARPNNRSTTKSGVEFGGVGSAIGALIAPIMDVLKPSKKENTIGNVRLNGNVQQVNGTQEYVYESSIKPKTTIRQMTENSINHMNINSQQHSNAYQIANPYVMPNQRDTTNYEEMGGPSMQNSGVFLEDAYRRQRNNVNKDIVPVNIHGNSDIFNNNINVDLSTKRMTECDRQGLYQGPSSVPSSQTHGAIHGSQYYNQCVDCERIDPNILKAFKENPFTQSLHSYA